MRVLLENSKNEEPQFHLDIRKMEIHIGEDIYYIEEDGHGIRIRTPDSGNLLKIQSTRRLS